MDIINKHLVNTVGMENDKKFKSFINEEEN